MTVQAPADQREARKVGGGLSNNPVLTFVPWIIFWIVAGPRTWEVASGCALLASVLLLLLGLETDPIIDRVVARSAGASRASSQAPTRIKAPKILDLGTSLFFVILVVVGLFVDRQDLIGLESYSQAISSAALGLIVVVSIALGHPFTEQYAREGVPKEQWHTPLFQRMMVTMSTVWAAIFGVMAVLGLVAKSGVGGAGSSDVLNWYIPIGLVIIALSSTSGIRLASGSRRPWGAVAIPRSPDRGASDRRRFRHLKTPLQMPTGQEQMEAPPVNGQS